MKSPHATTANRCGAMTRATLPSLKQLVLVSLLALISVSLVSPARAQSGRMRPEPQPSPSPGAQQQRPRRVAHDSDDALPGEPSTSNAPSRAGSLPQAQGTPPTKPNTTAPPQTDATPDIDESEVYKVESNLVPVSASVTDALGHSITDLKLEDFELRVDGQPQTISDLSRAETPVKLALLFDNSSSLRPTRELEKQAAVNFFRRVIRPSTDQASIFSISTFPSLDQPLTGDVSKLVRTIEHYGEAEGSTSLFDTIAMAAEYLRPQPGRKVMIIVSDGVETTSQLEDYGEMVRRVLASDCQVFVIQTGLSQNANLRDLTAERRMQDLTSYTGGFVFVPKAPSDLEVAFAQIAADLAQQYVLSYYPTDDGRDTRFRAISVRVKTRGGVQVRARRGYYPHRRENLTALPPGSQFSELSASMPDSIRDPASSSATQARPSAATQRASASIANSGANANTTPTRARTPALAASSSKRGSKNLDPDAGDDTSDASNAPKPAARLGTFVPQTQDASAQPSNEGADNSLPTKSSETPPAESRPQPSPQPIQQTSSPPIQAATQTATLRPAPPTADHPNPIQPAPSTTTTTVASSNATGEGTKNGSPSQPAQSSPAQNSAMQNSQTQNSATPSSASHATSQPPDSVQPANARNSTDANDAPQQPLIVSGGVLNGRARSLPVPPYPETARRAQVTGTVAVEVLVDEGGKVIAARAMSGPLMLRESAVAAARRATFPPVSVSGQPARLQGVINYTFKF